jgi:hypothetical protein
MRNPYTQVGPIALCGPKREREGRKESWIALHDTVGVEPID